MTRGRRLADDRAGSEAARPSPELCSDCLELLALPSIRACEPGQLPLAPGKGVEHPSIRIESISGQIGRQLPVGFRVSSLQLRVPGFQYRHSRKMAAGLGNRDCRPKSRREAVRAAQPRSRGFAVRYAGAPPFLVVVIMVKRRRTIEENLWCEAFFEREGIGTLPALPDPPPLQNLQ